MRLGCKSSWIVPKLIRIERLEIVMMMVKRKRRKA